MAYTNFQNCTANEYKSIIYNQETNNKIKILFNNVELEDADEYCESFEVVSKVIPNGSKIFMLENLVSQEATLVLHNIDTSIIQDQVSISIGTLVSENTYEYVPIGIYNLQEIPTTDNGKTTIKLRDNSVKLDFNYNAKPLIDLNGGSATKLQILQDICTKAGITCNVASFIGSSDLIGIYDNTITGRQYVSYLAGSAGAIPIITRSGALDFKYLNNLSIIQIPIEIVEQYSNAENFKISRVVYEDAIRKYESGNETYDTLFLDSANPYISSQEQVASIYNIVNNFEINSFTTGRILGNPAIDSYDLIQITDYDGTIFKTFANNTLRYNGKMINTFASEISFERKKENVSLKSGASFKKWAKTEIDNANAQITIQAGQIEEIEQDLSSPTNTLTGEYFDIEDALDEPLQGFSLYGDTQQDSTTQGKNLFDKDNANILNANLADSGTLSQTNNARTLYIPCKNNTTYTISKLQAVYFRVAEFTNTPTIGSSYINRIKNDSANYITFTTTTGNYLAVTYWYSSSTNTEQQVLDSIQIEKGSTATSYEPFVPNSPSPDYPQPIHNVSGDNTIEICGKNLFDYTTSTFATPTNVNITTENNTITMTTTITTNSNNLFFRTKIPDEYLINGETYTISSENVSGVAQPLQLQLRNKDGSFVSGKSQANSVVYDSNYSLYIAKNIFATSNISISAGTTAIIKNVQVEKGSTSSEYEAYQGNSQLISLGVENLFDNSLMVNWGSTIKYIPINVNTNTDYTLSTSNVGQGSSSANIFLSTTNSGVSSSANGVWLDRPRTINSGNNNVIYVAYRGTEGDDTKYWYQLEKGSKANSYTTYGTTPIELNKISTYQDYIYKDNDRWFFHKEIGKVVLNGSEDFLEVTASRYRLPGFTSIKQENSKVVAICTAYEGIPYDDRNSRAYSGHSILFSASANLYFNSSAFSSVSDFKTWLSTHNTIVYYVLNTPTDTEITDTTLLEQLNRLMTLPLYKNMTHITLTPNDLQPTMNIEYLRDTSINNNFVRQPQLENYYTKSETTAQIQIGNASIQQSVSELQETTNGNTGAITSLSNQVNTLQTSTSLQINAINEQLEDGVSKVKTTTGYTLDGNGLSITKGQGFSSLTTDRYQKIEYNNKELSFMGYDDTLNKPISRIEELEARKITTGVHRTETIQEDGEKWTAQYYVGGGN